MKFADIISNLRAIALSPPAGWSNDRRLGYLNSCRNLADAARGSNAEIERIFDNTAKALEQAIRTEGLGDIDGNASARRELEAAIGQPVHLVYVPNTRCRPLGAGESTCSVKRSRERSRRPRCKQRKAFTKAGADRCSSAKSGRTAATRSLILPSACASPLTSPLSASSSMGATSASTVTTLA